MFDSLLGRVSGGEDLSVEEMTTAIDLIMQGRVPEERIALLLTALRHKGESVAEVAGAASAMRRHMTPIRTSRTDFLDTCGTGGDGSATFNISTAAALVTAAVGVPVAKHGNRAVTSRSGSADVLDALGVNISASVPQIERCLDELGICFCFAPLFHGAMKHVAAVRKKLGVPTIFNLLGPLANPAGAPYQLLGVGKPHLRPLLAQALALLGTRRAAIVCGEDGLDEVTISGPTLVTEVTSGGLTEFTWNPAHFALTPQPLDSLKVEGPEESAEMIRQVLAGQAGAARDIVVANAAAALWVAGHDDNLAVCAQKAAAAIDEGTTAELLKQLAELSHA